MQRQLAAQQLVIQNGWGQNPVVEPPLVNIIWSREDFQDQTSLTITDAHWEEIQNIVEGSGEVSGLVDDIHQNMYSVLQKILHDVVGNSDDEDERIIHENIDAQARMDLVINNNDDNNMNNNNNDDMDEDPI